jgi:hypothetical protein
MCHTLLRGQTGSRETLHSLSTGRRVVSVGLGYVFMPQEAYVHAAIQVMPSAPDHLRVAHMAQRCFACHGLGIIRDPRLAASTAVRR